MGLQRRHVSSSSPPPSTPDSLLYPTSPPSAFSLWSPNPERARGEQFFLCWAFVWVSLMAYIVYTRWFESFTPWHYLSVGLFLFFAPTIIPLLVPSLFLSSKLPVLRRYTTKANAYIFILAWNANYFWYALHAHSHASACSVHAHCSPSPPPLSPRSPCAVCVCRTHYFYTVLHATYTFPAHRLNDVPFALYLITHSYFHLYHALACILLRVAHRLGGRGRGGAVACAVAVCAFSVLTAFMETWSIQHFQYYDIPDRWAMYAYGSVFYGLYFVVSYPMFWALDERSNAWSLWRTVVDAMACSMLITTLLDAWRLTIGTVTDKPPARATPIAVPFIH